MANRIADPAQYTTKTTLGGGELLHSNDANQDRLFSVDTLSTYAGNKAIPPGYIDGLVLTWVNGTAITVTSGAAYIPSLSRVLRAPSDIAKTGLSLAASTWYHVYLFLNGSTPDIEIVTTAPSATYNGGARTKTGDTSRRYLGSVRTDTSPVMYQFVQYGLQFRYFTGGGTPFRAISNGTATSRTNIDISSYVPVTGVTALVKAQNSSTGSQALIVDSAASGLTGFAGFFIVGQPGTQAIGDVPTLGSNNLQYLWTSAPVTQGAFIDILGYTIQR